MAKNLKTLFTDQFLSCFQTPAALIFSIRQRSPDRKRTRDLYKIDKMYLRALSHGKPACVIYRAAPVTKHRHHCGKPRFTSLGSHLLKLQRCPRLFYSSGNRKLRPNSWDFLADFEQFVRQRGDNDSSIPLIDILECIAECLRAFRSDLYKGGTVYDYACRVILQEQCGCCLNGRPNIRSYTPPQGYCIFSGFNYHNNLL